LAFDREKRVEFAFTTGADANKIKTSGLKDPYPYFTLNLPTNIIHKYLLKMCIRGQKI
jgi:hypothetical protein